MMAKAFDARALAVGDRVPGGWGAEPLYRPGPAQWHALRVAPQRESFVERWLARRGVLGFHPVLSTVVVRKGRRIEQNTRYLPGYVFARFPGTPVEYRVTALDDIGGALTDHAGGWACIHPADLRALYAMRMVDAAIESAQALAAARRREALALRPGGGALFRAGPMAGTPCEVVEISGNGNVRVRLRLFGADHLVAARAVDLVSTRKGD